VRKDPGATYAADVFSFILAQENSRFQKTLVDSGLALSANVGYYTLNHTGPISVSLVARPGKLEEATKALKAEMKKFDDPDYFTDEQIQTAKTLLAVDHVYGREKTSSYAHNVSFWWAVAGLDYYINYVDNLQKVSRDDLKRYVSTYILGKPYVMGVLISQENQQLIGLNQDKINKWAQPIKP
jgi:zinc protease